MITLIFLKTPARTGGGFGLTDIKEFILATDIDDARRQCSDRGHTMLAGWLYNQYNIPAGSYEHNNVIMLVD